jgi:hypothetical protein
MINDPVYKHFLELSWRRKLTSAEEEELRTWLESHPEAQEEWEAETGLNDMLGMMPDTAVPSNFHARVMQGIEQETAADRRHLTRQRRAWWQRMLRRIALASGVMVTGLLAYQHFHAVQLREKAKQAEVAQGFITVSKVPFLPDPETLEDFDTIRLGSGLIADEKLLTLLQ